MKTSAYAIVFAAIISYSEAHADFLKDLGNAVTAPIRAPAQLARDVIHGQPPNAIVQNQLNIRVGAPAVAAGSTLQLIQRGNDIVHSIPRTLISNNLGGDWLRGYDTLTASQRIQQELTFTTGRFLSQCAATGQCSIEQAAAMPVAAALRDAYKTYFNYSQPLPPQLAMMLGRVVPPQVVNAARWSVGNTPDMTVPGFLNSGHTAFGQNHAVTVGNIMIFSSMPNLNRSDDVVWLLHEMFHIEQYMRYSGNPLESIDGFAVDYIRNYSGMEDEAQNNAVARYNILYSFAQQ
jgi:hypothetical protein